jgi:hypothetical protein
MSLPKLTITEARVLLVLLDGYRRDSNVFTFKGISDRIDAPASVSAVKRACRSLARKGLVEHSPFFYEHDGKLGGSGYTLTCQGMVEVRFFEEVVKHQVNSYAPRHPVQKLHPEGTSVPQPVLHQEESAPPQADDVLLRGEWREWQQWDDNGGAPAPGPKLFTRELGERAGLRKPEPVRRWWHFFLPKRSGYDGSSDI